MKSFLPFATQFVEMRQVVCRFPGAVFRGEREAVARLFRIAVDQAQDADVLIHAICDALLGAANMRDIGYHFPDTAGEFKNIDSKILLAETVDLIAAKGYKVGNVDATICAERPKLKARIPEMQLVLAHLMRIDVDDVSVKATTTEKLGFTGREEGISAYATVLIEKAE